MLHTPTETAQKFWIGGAAVHGTHAIVFAQLIVDRKNHGVHPFVVQLRERVNQKSDEPVYNQVKMMPGVTIEDCGLKMGLNGGQV